MKKNDWNIWKAAGRWFILPTTERPHDHIDPKIPAEMKANLGSVTEEMADRVMAVLSDRKCQACGGGGEIVMDRDSLEETTCPQCGGTGKGY
jgi:hypothetical protein